MQLTFLDDPADLAVPDAFTANSAAWPRVRHLVSYRGPNVTGTDASNAVGGWLVQPVETVLALPGWEDAFETVADDVLFTVFDVEKIVRMLLHGSHLAVEILGSGARYLGDDESRDVLQWTLNTRHLAAAEDAANTLRKSSPDATIYTIDLTRRYLQGAALSRGFFGMHLDVLTRHFGVERPASHEAAIQILDAVPLKDQNRVLPDAPTDYDRLSRWLVEKRLETV